MDSNHPPFLFPALGTPIWQGLVGRPDLLSFIFNVMGVGSKVSLPRCMLMYTRQPCSAPPPPSPQHTLDYPEARARTHTFMHTRTHERAQPLGLQVRSSPTPTPHIHSIAVPLLTSFYFTHLPRCIHRPHLVHCSLTYTFCQPSLFDYI